MTPSSYGPFDFQLTQAQLRQVRELLDKAQVAGIAPQFSADVRTILDNLQFRPREWGDPLVHLNEMKMIVYRGIHSKISVTYGVHDRLPLIFVSRIDLILNHPFET